MPILTETRIQKDAILENYEGGSPVEDIADNFSIVLFQAQQRARQLSRTLGS